LPLLTRYIRARARPDTDFDPAGFAELYAIMWRSGIRACSAPSPLNRRDGKPQYLRHQTDLDLSKSLAGRIQRWRRLRMYAANVPPARGRFTSLLASQPLSKTGHAAGVSSHFLKRECGPWRRQNGARGIESYSRRALRRT